MVVKLLSWQDVGICFGYRSIFGGRIKRGQGHAKATSKEGNCRRRKYSMIEKDCLEDAGSEVVFASSCRVEGG